MIGDGLHDPPSLLRRQVAFLEDVHGYTWICAPEQEMIWSDGFRIVRVDADVCEGTTIQQILHLGERGGQDLVRYSLAVHHKHKGSLGRFNQALQRAAVVRRDGRNKFPRDAAAAELLVDI